MMLGADRLRGNKLFESLLALLAIVAVALSASLPRGYMFEASADSDYSVIFCSGSQPEQMSIEARERLAELAALLGEPSDHGDRSHAERLCEFSAAQSPIEFASPPALSSHEAGFYFYPWRAVEAPTALRGSPLRFEAPRGPPSYA